MQSSPNNVLLTCFVLLCLSATGAKERQHWVSRLQICTQHHTEAMGKVSWCVLSMHIGAQRCLFPKITMARSCSFRQICKELLYHQLTQTGLGHRVDVGDSFQLLFFFFSHVLILAEQCEILKSSEILMLKSKDVSLITSIDLCIDLQTISLPAVYFNVLSYMRTKSRRLSFLLFLEVGAF